jgi:hypothetical protein
VRRILFFSHSPDFYGAERRAAGRAEALVAEAVYLVASRLCDAVFGLGNERLLRAQLAALGGK